MSEKLNRFVDLMKSIFELDKSDLDFGIYRIMNIRKDEIEKFLFEGLPQKVQDTLASFASNTADIEKRIAEIEKQCDEVGIEVEKSKMAQEYSRLKGELAAGVDISALETDVYSALYSFFNRYYDEGDFISKRRYKEGVYAIPYEGEEVKLYWANQDQYYIKTAENFKDYTFVDEGRKVHFRLVEATIEQNNNKESDDKKRTFMLYEETDERPELRTMEVIDGELYIRFVFDIPTDKKTKYAEENYKKISAAITNQFKDWFNLLRPTASKDPKKVKSVLEKHLEAYVAKNTFDYFIHKDLRGFLTRELDFYIKNEVIHLDDLDTTDEKRVDTYLAKVKAIKRVGKIIIDFLAQIENFQKKLWLKKKFVVSTDWCITLDKIDEAFYDEIIKNKAQVQEWIDMYAIDEIKGDLTTVAYSEPLTLDFVRQNQNLIIDTKHFSTDFKDRLIATIDNLDEQTGGLLIHSENFQALSVLQKKYCQKIRCIYIDPPYNTNATPIVYKNGYKDSSWISLMHDRLLISRTLLKLNNGYFSIAIDDTELHNLYKLMEMDLSPMELLQVIVNHYPGSGTGRSNVSKTHEYNLFAIPKETDILRGKVKEAGERVRGFCRSGTGANNYRHGRPNSFYAVLVNPESHTIVGFEKPPSIDDDYPTEDTQDGYLRVYPLGADGSERCWSLGYESAQKFLDLGLLQCSENNVIRRLYYDETDRELLPSLWVDTQFSAVVNGTNLLTSMFKNSGLFSFPKSLYTVKTAVEAGTFDDFECVVLDFFAGSGTTGHAVLDINRNDGGSRKYILVEMGEYFDIITKPRIQKAVYSTDWKNGKPQSRNTGVSHIMKYLRLESYEDALSNIKLSEENHQMLTLFGEEYLINYMLDVESQGSLLYLDSFRTPFSYKMKINENNETKEKVVDLCETFNYLIGLSVIRQSVVSYFRAEYDKDGTYEGAVRLIKDIDGQFAFKQIEGTLPDGRRVLVIWRTITDNLIESNAALDAYFNKHRINPLDREFDIIYVNGDNNLENLKTNDEYWKVNMIEPEFKLRMFEEV